MKLHPVSYRRAARFFAAPTERVIFEIDFSQLPDTNPELPPPRPDYYHKKSYPECYPKKWVPWKVSPGGRFAFWITVLEFREHERIAYRPPRKPPPRQKRFDEMTATPGVNRRKKKK